MASAKALIDRFRTRPAAVEPPARSRPSLGEAMQQAQAAWLAELTPFRNHLGVIEMPGYPLLSEAHLANCRVLPVRQAILARMPKGGKVAELGVQEGVFSRDILDTCTPSELHLIDIDLTGYRIAERFASEIARGTVALHEGDSAEAIARFPDSYFDFIYIDADHSYEAVKKDIAASAPKVRGDGYLLFNDYTFWSPAECMPYGVIQAVNEFCIAEGWEAVYFAFGHMGYSDIAIRRSTR